MPTRNKNIRRGRRAEHIPVQQLALGNVLLSALTLTEGTPNTLSASTLTLGGYTSAAAVVEQINGTGETGLKMSTDGNAILYDWMVPLDLDAAYEVRLRLNWATESTTSTHGALFTITRKAYVRGGRGAAGTALSATVSTALNTVIAADTVGTPNAAYQLNTTESGIISAGLLTPGEHQTLKIAMTTKTGATNIWLRGLEYEYVPAYSGQDGAVGPVIDSAWT